ncbi:hypothetical protein BGZ65_011102, partial [Modicella reniformis]
MRTPTLKNIIFNIVGDRLLLETVTPLSTLHSTIYNLQLQQTKIKKLNAKDDDLEGDQRKLPSMMKLIL